MSLFREFRPIFYRYVNICAVIIACIIVIYSIIWSLRSFWSLPVLTLFISISILAGVIVHIILQNIEVTISYSEKNSSDILIQIMSSALILYSLVTLINATYVRTLSFFISLSFAIGLLGWQIINSFRITQTLAISLMIQIMVVAVLLKSSTYLVNGYVPAADSTYYSQIVEAALVEGRLTSSLQPYPTHWLFFPNSVFYNMVASQMLGFGAKYTPMPTFLSVIVLPLSAYLIGQTMRETKLGLLVALLVATSYPVAHSPGMTPATFGAILFLMPLALFLRSWKERKNFLLFYITAISGFLYYPVLALILIAMLLTISYYRKIVFGVLAYGVFFLAYCIYWTVNFFNILVTQMFPKGYVYTPTVVPPGVETFNLGVMLGYLFSHLGLILIIFLATVAWMGWFTGRRRNPDEFVIWVGTPALLAIVAVGVLLGSFSFSLIRVYAYFFVAASILAAVGILRLLTYRHKFIVKIICIFLIISFSFFTQLSPNSDPDNNLLTFDLVTGYVYMPQPALSASSIVSLIPRTETVVMDHASMLYFGAYNPKISGSKEWMETGSLYKMGFQNASLLNYHTVRQKGAYIILNSKLLKRGTLVGGVMRRLDENQLRTQLKYSNQIFASKDFHIYMNP